MADNGWRDVVLVTMRETPSKKPGDVGVGYGLWVVARIKPDNTLFGVTIRSGRYRPNKLDGSKELPKEGLGFYDLMELKKPGKTEETKWQEVVKLLDPKNPPVIPAQDAPAEAAPPPEPEIEMPPW